MEFKDLSKEDVEEYKELINLWDQLSEIDIDAELTVNIPVLDREVKFQLKEVMTFRWDTEDSGMVFSSFADRHGDIDSPDMKEVVNKVQELINEKVKQVCDRVEAWENKTGLDFFAVDLGNLE